MAQRKSRASNGGVPSRAEVLAKVEAVDARLEGMENTVTAKHDGLQKYLEEKFSNVEDKIDGLGNRIGDVEDRTAAIETLHAQQRGARRVFNVIGTLLAGAAGGFFEWVRHGGRRP